MDDETWALIREAMDKIAAGMTRCDFDTADAKISVYRVGQIIRCDVKNQS